MKKVGDLLTAFGVVGFLAVVLEFIIGWRMEAIDRGTTGTSA